MRSVMECLDKAAEMDRYAADCDAPALSEQRAFFLQLGYHWRALAIRALRQDTWSEVNATKR
jgi:hypothetical protein